MPNAVIAILGLSLLFVGCYTHRTEAVAPGEIEGRALSFLEDGVTTRGAIQESLGAPSGRFEDDRILTYRLDAQYQVVPALLVPGKTSTGFGWGMERFSLVLVFGADGVLERHRLIRIR